MRRYLVSLLFLTLLFSSAAAFQNDRKLVDPENEVKAQSFFKEIRCLVCKGESLAESNADLAVDMRTLIREKISNGESEDQIKDYLVFRYGKGILQEPPFEPQTYLLWLLPAILFIIGTVGIFYIIFAKKIKWVPRSAK